MAKKRHTPAKIVAKLRRVGVPTEQRRAVHKMSTEQRARLPDCRQRRDEEESLGLERPKHPVQKKSGKLGLARPRSYTHYGIRESFAA